MHLEREMPRALCGWPVGSVYTPRVAPVQAPPKPGWADSGSRNACGLCGEPGHNARSCGRAAPTCPICNERPRKRDSCAYHKTCGDGGCLRVLRRIRHCGRCGELGHQSQTCGRVAPKCPVCQERPCGIDRWDNTYLKTCGDSRCVGRAIARGARSRWKGRVQKLPAPACPICVERPCKWDAEYGRYRVTCGDGACVKGTRAGGFCRTCGERGHESTACTSPPKLCGCGKPRMVDKLRRTHVSCGDAECIRKLKAAGAAVRQAMAEAAA